MVDREWIIKKVLAVLSMLVVVGILLIVVFVTKAALPVITKVGLFNLFSSNWYPPTGHYGIMIFIVGTLLTTVGGLLIGAPLALGTALFLTEMAPSAESSTNSANSSPYPNVPDAVAMVFFSRRGPS